MKLSNIVKTLSIAALAFSTASAMIEVELQNKNLLQAQKIGSQFKRERDAARLVGKALHHDGAYDATDTAALIEDAHNGNHAKFGPMAKAGVKALTNAWIDTILGANNNFIDAAVARQDNGGGGTTPADRSRNAFKTALDAVIDGVAYATVASANKRLTTISATRAALVAEIDAAVALWITGTLMPGGNNAFIDGGVARQDNGGAGDTPADVNRDSFIAALSTVITSY